MATAKERVQNIFRLIKERMTTDEMDFVEGERVQCIKGNNLLEVGTKGVVQVSWKGTEAEVEMNCFVITILTDDGSNWHGPRLDDSWVSIDPRWAPKKTR